MIKLIEKLKDKWGYSVAACFRTVYGDFKLSFANRDKELQAMKDHERKQYYFNCLEATQAGAVQKEAQAIIQTLYCEAALDPLTENERTSKKYAVLVLGQLLKRLHDLGARSKPANVDEPVGTQL